MTQKESDKIDVALVCLALAENKGADKTDLLNAFVYDTHLIRKGENPTETQNVLDNLLLT